jgi:site-specific recombinase XerD
MSGDKASPAIAGPRAANELGPPLSVAEREGSERLFALFCAHKRGTMGNAASTVQNARSKLDSALRFIGLPPWAWRPEHIDAHLTHQADVEGNHAATQATRISTLRQFQNWLLHDRGLCNECAREFGVRPERFITEENSIPHRRKSHQRRAPIFPLKSKQAQRLIEEFDFAIETARRLGKKSLNTLRRDKAITLLLLFTGIRAGELTSLRAANFLSDPKHPQFGDYAILRVVGKAPKSAQSVYSIQPSNRSWIGISIMCGRPSSQGERKILHCCSFLSADARYAIANTGGHYEK